MHEIFAAYQRALFDENGVGMEIGFHPNLVSLNAALPNGSVTQVKAALSSILSIGTPSVTTRDENWGTIFAGFQGLSADEPGNASVISLFANEPFPDTAIDVVNEFILGGSPPPTDESNYQMGGMGGAVKRSEPPGGAAFAHRDALVDRLRRIKAKCDPDNIFRYEQSIPPASS